MSIQELRHLGERHHQEFQAFAFGLTQDTERARDLIQDSIYLVIKYRDSFRAGTNFSSWVKTIIRNTFITDYRRGARRRTLLDKKPPTDNWITHTVSENPAEANLGLEELLQLVNELPPPYRQAFQLYASGLKHAQIALRLHAPVGTIKSRVFTAKRLLRERINTIQ